MIDYSLKKCLEISSDNEGENRNIYIYKIKRNLSTNSLQTHPYFDVKNTVYNTHGRKLLPPLSPPTTLNYIKHDTISLRFVTFHSFLIDLQTVLWHERRQKKTEKHNEKSSIKWEVREKGCKYLTAAAAYFTTSLYYFFAILKLCRLLCCALWVFFSTFYLYYFLHQITCNCWRVWWKVTLHNNNAFSFYEQKKKRN